MQTELTYPVIVLPRNNSMIYVYFKERDLKSTSEELLQKLDYSNLDLIDVLGRKYKIKRAFKVKYLGLWGFNPLLKGRQILIDFELNSIENVRLEDVQQELIKRVEKNKRFWESAWDIEELKEKLQGSKTFDEIANLLG